MDQAGRMKNRSYLCKEKIRGFTTVVNKTK